MLRPSPVILALILAALSPAALADKTITALVGATVLPMDAERRLERQTVLVRGDRIVAIGTKLPLPEGARVIDASGKFLMPGLADMHVHVWNQKQFPLFLANGVTTIRNMWGAPVHRRWLAEAEAGTLHAPTVLSTGPIVDGSPPVWPGSVGLENPGQAAGAIAAQAAAGFTEVKVYSKLDRATFAAVATAAAQHGMRVVGHVPAAVDLEDAFAAGQRGVEHLTGYAQALQADDSPLRTMTVEERLQLSIVERVKIGGRHVDEGRFAAVARMTLAWGVWNTPTLLVMERMMADADRKAELSQRDEMRYLAPSTRAFWKPANDFRLADMSEKDRRAYSDALAIRTRIVAALHEAGCDLLLGTDTPNPFVFPGFSIHEELERLVAAGLSPFEALRMGTANASRFMDQQNEWGRVATGLRADLLLLDADPTADIANTRKIAGVMLRGRWLPKKELDAMLEGVAAFYEANPDYNPFGELRGGVDP